MPLTAEQILQSEFLQARAKILELAATLDRIERAGGNVPRTGTVPEHPQMKLLREGFNILLSENQDKAAAVQLLFSRPYEPNWQTAYSV